MVKKERMETPGTFKIYSKYSKHPQKLITFRVINVYVTYTLEKVSFYLKRLVNENTEIFKHCCINQSSLKK
jgi:hypothetical protein